MLFDTDVIIWFQRGSLRAAEIIDKAKARFISAQSYMELLQCASNMSQQKLVKSFLHDLSFQVLPLTENIGHRAMVYVEQYSLSHGMRAGDAIIAATASEQNLTLISGNAKHFRPIKDLEFRQFKNAT